MYVPQHFEETRIDELHRLIREYPLGVMVLHGPDGLDAHHLPFELNAADGEHGHLIAHVARANPVWQQVHDGEEVLVVFRGGDAYISPNWYTSPNLVPTWNYTAVHAYGTPRILAESADALAVVERLAAYFEAALPQPWSTAKLPPGNALAQMKGIVAFDMPISRLQAKAKLGQNRLDADRYAAADALEKQGGEDNVAVAALMRGAGAPPA